MRLSLPWIRGLRYDAAFILAPPFVSLLIVALLPAQYKGTAAMPLAAWVVLVLLVDVAHVWSTLFRTYLDKERMARQRTLFLAAPVLCYGAGVVLYSLGSLVFWRTLAYLAVWHFVRQQYGFMRIYARKESSARWARTLDAVAVYAATLYPLVWWHLSPGRNFDWFVEGDFVVGDGAVWRAAVGGLYAGILLAYVGKELWLLHRGGALNAPRNLLILGTAASWYFGIVVFNGDLAFTLLNVVAHGIPYMALVWHTARGARGPATKALAARSGWVVFLLALFALAFLEEGLWDGLVWREHSGLFAMFSALPRIGDHTALSLLVPLLALPQATHYVLDAFIWRRRDG